MKHTGWRKPTPGLGVAEQLAQAGERVAVPKTQAFVAVKRVGAHIGLKAGDMMLLDTLGAFTQAQDWEEGRRPIVWASNAYLIEQTGFSLSALKRHARRLAEIGVISFKDSPNGKRWGRRDADGVIIEAYGFDLSPLSARVEEFEQLQAELQVEREICQRLKRQITVARRMIRARIEAALSGALRGPWAHLGSLF
ncbi:MAG: plasmid replication protein RepC, partial [Sulfitobacter sp.]|nr:plasmid replication protein RepC [Sulfitobacter sp.]